jgi:hypothetical protein
MSRDTNKEIEKKIAPILIALQGEYEVNAKEMSTEGFNRIVGHIMDLYDGIDEIRLLERKRTLEEVIQYYENDLERGYKNGFDDACSSLGKGRDDRTALSRAIEFAEKENKNNKYVLELSKLKYKDNEKQ